MNDTLLDATGAPIGQWRLSEVQVANWGTFDGAIYRVPVARRGHLITGPSGSGKSSLLDAMAAVLTPDKWLRLNRAAQGAGGKANQRTLLSYLRGAWSRTVDETEDRVVSAYLRPRATWSGIVLRFEDGAGQQVSLARLFFLRATASSSADINDLCLLERGEVDLRDLEPFVSSGLETRKVQARWPDAVVTSNQSHARFYARMRSLFGIANESALQLLHKTQSAKSLDSLDQLFRDYMLDRPATFDLAQTAVTQFGELRDAHQRVVELREQRDQLLTLRGHVERYEVARGKASTAGELMNAVGPYQHRRSIELAQAELDTHKERLLVLQIAAEKAEQAHTDADEAWRMANAQKLNLGGDLANRLHERLTEAGREASAVAERWKRFEEDLKHAGVDTAPADATAFAELMRAIDEILGDDRVTAGPTHEQLDRMSLARRRVDDLQREIGSLRRTGSTVPDTLLRIRSELADSLGLPATALPYAGELVEVVPQYAAWQGAIERVLRPLALTLLVRSEHLRAVRQWVDSRRLPGRLVFEEVIGVPGTPRPAGSEVSLVNRVQVAPGQFAGWLMHQLSERYDYACVDTTDELGGHIRAVTINGQVKTSRTRYEKDDRRAVDDRAHWVLGDKVGKLDALVELLRVAEANLDLAQHDVDRILRIQAEAQRRRGILQTLQSRQWQELDHASALTAVRGLESQLQALTRDDSRLGNAIEAEVRASRQRTRADEERRAAGVALAGCQSSIAAVREFLDQRRGELRDHPEPDLPEVVTSALDARFRAQRRNLTREVLFEVGHQVTRTLGQERDQAMREEQRAAENVVSVATAFNAAWPAAAAAAELTPGVADRGNYLELLDTIVGHGLPDHEANFLRLLRERTRDMIGELVSDILSAPGQISERVSPVNASLKRSQFDDGRYLHLRVKTKRSQTVTAFISDLRSIAEGSWTDDDLASAENRFATMAEIMRKLASSEHADRLWRQQCLDTRLHVTFLAEEQDADGRVHATYDSGAAMSGGQQQKLVIFCLAAALRYQLAAAEEDHSRYGTIVLDEAFDKADTRYTRMALDVFVEFGFQMILATPQKLLQTIESYIGGATAVENPSRQRSMASQVQWEQGASGGVEGAAGAERE